MAGDLSDFLEVVVREAELVERFVRLLEQEKTLLTEGRTEALTIAVEEKERLAADLNDLSQQRARHLIDHGYTPDRAGMAAWSAGHAEHQEAVAAWNRTLSLAAQAKELNRVNGQLIQLHMQFTGQALEILLRKEGKLDLYGPDGRSTASGDRQINDAV
jgi:flagella synthesis protein FlgN